MSGAQRLHVQESGIMDYHANCQGYNQDLNLK